MGYALDEKAVGKKAEPTVDELEFIYARIEENLPDSEIIMELINDGFPERTTGSIKRRKKEYYAAKKVLEEFVSKKVDPVSSEQKIRHWNDLADTAKKLYRNLDTVKKSNGKLSGDILSGSMISGHQESPLVLDAKYKTPLERVNRQLAEGLLSHIQAEFHEFNNFTDWRLLKEEDIKSIVTREMLRDLENVSHRRTFRKSCAICKPWDTQKPKSVEPWKLKLKNY
jgi:hypothetical protein